MLLQKVRNYSRLAVFGLEEKILLHLQRNSAYTTIELTFLKSMSRWYLDYRKLVRDHWGKNSETNDRNHREEVEHTLGNSSVWLDNFLLGVQHCLKIRHVSCLFTDKLLGCIHYAIIKPLIF